MPPFSISVCLTTLCREPAGQVIVDYIDTDLFCALLGVVILGSAEIVDQKRYIITDSLVVRFESLGIVILDRTTEIGVIKKWFQHLSLQIVDIAFMERLIESRFSGVFSFRQNLLGQCPGGVLLLGFPAEVVAFARRD